MMPVSISTIIASEIDFVRQYFAYAKPQSLLFAKRLILVKLALIRLRPRFPIRFRVERGGAGSILAETR
jgi:hypothetical protein